MTDHISKMPPPAESSSHEIEYVQTIAYVFHMYETRHQVFKFVVGINTALLAVVFQFLTSNIAKSVLSIFGGIVTLALTLMARRSLRYLAELEKYAQELEGQLSFGLVRETSARMPKGIDSNVYFFIVYWVLVAIWTILSIYFVLRLFVANLPQL
jgi:hypothetical protein